MSGDPIEPLSDPDLQMQTVSEFESERHALYVGWIIGTAMRNRVLARPIVDADDNYTDRIAIDLPDGNTITFVVPPPPDDWTFPPDE